MDLSDLNEDQKGILDYLLQQMRNVCTGWSVTEALPLQDRWVEAVLDTGGGKVSVLLVVEDNIKLRLMKSTDQSAPWRCPVDPTGYNLVGLTYGWGKDPGAIEPKSEGNQNKDDYRRLEAGPRVQRYSPISPRVVLYREIRKPFSEARLNQLVAEALAAGSV